MRFILALIAVLAATSLQAQHDHDHDHDHDEHCEHGSEVRFRLLDLSLNLMTAAGTATATNGELRNLQLGNHDPRRRGFNLQQAEFAFAGAVEPYFAGEAYIVASDHGVELEEAFLRSLSLAPVELKAGYFFTEFGRINRLHPHSWRWADAPVANSRLLSPEGMRGVGARASVELPLPWHSRFYAAVQNADDASMISFLGEGHDHGHGDEEHDETVGGWPHAERPTRTLGDLLYSARFENGTRGLGADWDLGLSGAYGPNATGDAGRTWLGGADAKARWQGESGFVQVEAEFVYRYFQAARASFVEDDEIETLNASVLSDWGAWVELYGGLGDWRAGLRLEHASGFRSGEGERRNDPMRDNRYRVSPLVGWQPVDTVYVSLQYNFDHAGHVGGRTSHGVWLGIRVLFGLHKHVD